MEGAGKEPHKGMEGRHQAVFSPGLPQYPEPASSCQDTAGRHVSSRPVPVPNKVFFVVVFLFLLLSCVGYVVLKEQCRFRHGEGGVGVWGVYFDEMLPAFGTLAHSLHPFAH